MNNKIIIGSILLFLTAASWAQNLYEGGGQSSNPFLRMDISPRVSGLGNAFTAIADDENAILYNPAGLAKLGIAGVAFNHTQWFEDIKIENLLFGYKISPKLGFGLAASYMGMPPIKGLGEEEFDVSSSIVHMAFGYNIYKNMMFGAGVKYFNDDLAGYSGTGVAFDVGYYMDIPISGLSFGLAAQNIGAEIKYYVEKEKIPLVIRSGIAYSLPRVNLQFALDVLKSNDQDFHYNFGVEYTYARFISMRLGNQSVDGKVLAPSFGVGYSNRDRYLLDYTFTTKEDLGATHRVGLTIRFNLPYIFKGNPITPTVNLNRNVISPKGITSDVIDDKLVIKWQSVQGASYNVYAKSAKDSPWRKLNKSPLNDTQLEFKKPTTDTKYFLTVTSIINNIESAFDEETEINVK